MTLDATFAQKIVTPACFVRSILFLYQKIAKMLGFLVVPKLSDSQLWYDRLGHKVSRWTYAHLTLPISNSLCYAVAVCATITLPKGPH